MNSSFLLIYLYSIYTFYFFYKTKNHNEFLLILTIYLFFLQMGPFPNRIESILNSPINIRPMDISLLMLIIYSLHKKFNNKNHNPVMYKSFLVTFYIFIILFYVFYGLIQFGYPSLAELRSVFFFLIILIFISININREEIIYLINKLVNYLIPLILLVPLNLILTGNFEVNIQNRQLNAFVYETITLGFLIGILYYQYIDRSFKKVWYLFPIFIAVIPYCSHRTVWAIIFISFPLILSWSKKRINLIFSIILGIIFLIYLKLDPSFLKNRLMAFTNFENDPTGSWRLLIWKTVIENATFFGHGLGARFNVYAPLIGWKARAGAHNGFVQTLYYTGYFGLILFILFIIYLLKIFLKKIYNTNNYKNYSMTFVYRVSFLSTVALILYMMGYGPDLISWYFIGFGLKLAYLQNKNNEAFRI